MKLLGRFAFGSFAMLCLAAVALILGGCSGPGGAAIGPPDISPSSNAAKAIELYDKDGDGQLSEAELEACPGILSAVGSYDTNSDGQVSEEEIEAHLQSILNSGISLLGVNCTIKKARRPLGNVKVRFVPEEFLEGAVAEAVGTTDQNGMAMMIAVEEQLPEDYRGLGKMQTGVYRVEIEGHEPGPDDPPLGFDVDPMSRNVNEVTFNLK